jgi:hypothetical protein
MLGKAGDEVTDAAGGLMEWWPIDWLNLAQQRVFGAYQPRISAILFKVNVLCAGAYTIVAIWVADGARVRGSAPLIARKEFKDMNVPLTQDNQVLEVIASQGGRPVQRNVDYFDPIL